MNNIKNCQYGTVDFRGRRPSAGRTRYQSKKSTLTKYLPLKMLIFQRFILAKQGFHSSTSLEFYRDARAEATAADWF